MSSNLEISLSKKMRKDAEDEKKKKKRKEKPSWNLQRSNFLYCVKFSSGLSLR